MRSRIALNALALRPGGSGVQTYIRELLGALPGVTDAELLAVVQQDVVPGLPVGVHAVPVRTVRGVRRAVAGLRIGVDAELVHGLDVIVPLRTRVPAVATIHDLSVFDVPWAFSRRQAAARRVLTRRSARTVDVLIADSPFTADRIRAVLGRDPVVIMLAPPSDCVPPTRAAVDDVRRRYGLPEEFVLHVGTVEPRKDVPGLAAACGIAGVPLVLAGAGGDVVGARGLGYVPRVDLISLYGAATLVAYPSRYEGFGLPAVEAAACGAPVVASTVGALREVLGDGAAFVPPEDIDALARTVGELWRDVEMRRELARTGQARASSLSWKRTAEETVAVYRSLGVAS